MKKRNERNELSFSDICFKTREGKKEKLRRDKEREKERKKIKLETGNQDIPAYIHDYETAR